MILETVSTTLTVALCLSNVFSTFKTLQQRAEEATFRVELQFWSVYVVGIILTSAIGWFRGDPTSHIQLLLSIILVLFKHFDSEHAFLSSIFNLSRKVMNFLDKHFISPNVEKFLLQPCTQLVEYGLQTLRKSKSISKEDRSYAAASIQRCNVLLRGEMSRRDREWFSETLSGSSDTAAQPEAPDFLTRRQESAPAAPQTPKRQPSLTFATLQRYFSEAGVLKSDEEIGQVLKKFQGRHAELRRRLEKKFSLRIGEPNDNVTTPRSAGTIGATKSSSSSSGLDGAGPFTDNVVLRRRKTTGGLD